MAKQIIDDTVMENIEILAKLALTCEERERPEKKCRKYWKHRPGRNHGNRIHRKEKYSSGKQSRSAGSRKSH